MKIRNKKLKALVLCAATAIMTFASPLTVEAGYGYTYNYDYWGDVQYSPDAYEVGGVFTSSELGLDTKLNAPQGMFVSGRKVYICDTGNNRIVVLTRDTEESFKVENIIESFNLGSNADTDVNTFNMPTDISVSEEGDMYIADQNNNRIVKLDKDLNYKMSFTKPTDQTFDQSITFLPSKISVDTAGRVYCIAVNVNQGLIKFENDGVFSGFVGATKVTYEWTDYIWKKLATKEQRAQMASFVPTEYDNLFIDHEGFVYVCTTNVSEADLDSGAATPIRRLNMIGNDILVRNGNYEIIGDIEWDNAAGYDGPSLITDITALENDVYVALDKTRGRLFAYDDQGRMLYAFGGNGNMDGYFKKPIAIDHMGNDLLVLDDQDCSITLFTNTIFGKNIFKAIEQFQLGQYTESGQSWQAVMDMNGNYDLAYIGIGRSLLRQKKYGEALDYFKLKYDEDNYSKAFKQYRKAWVEDHIGIIFVLFFLVLIVPLAIGKVKKLKIEIDTADIFKYEHLRK